MMFNDKIYVHRFPLYAEGKNPILRALRYALCCGMQLYYGLKAKNCDVIFVPSTPPIQGAMAAIIKKIKHIPFVYNIKIVSEHFLKVNNFKHIFFNNILYAVKNTFIRIYKYPD